MVNGTAHTKLGQNAFKQPGVLAQRALVVVGRARLGFGQHRQLRQLEPAGIGKGEGLLALTGLSARGLGRIDRRADDRGGRFTQRASSVRLKPCGWIKTLGMLDGVSPFAPGSYWFGLTDDSLSGAQAGKPTQYRCQSQALQAKGVA